MDTQAYLLIGLLIAVIVLGPFLLRVLFNKTGDAVVNKYRESTNNAVNQANAAAGPQRLADRYPGFLESMGLASAAAAAQAAAPKPAEAPKPVQEPQKVFCMYCGKQIASGAAFCPYCGKKQA